MSTGSVNVGGRMVPQSEAGTMASQEAERIRNSGGGGGGGGGGGSCFPGDAMVLTPEGWVPIGSIRKEELVVSMQSDGSFSTAKILKKKTYKESTIFEVYDDKGALLFRSTKSHSIYSERGWVRVGDLISGDVIFHHDGDANLAQSIIGSVNKAKSSEVVYNLIIDSEFTFVVKGCVAHSFTHLRTLRSFAWGLHPRWLALRSSKTFTLGRSDLVTQ